MNAIQSAVLPELPDIDDVAPWGAADQQLFAELRAVLERHDAVSRFGITLLHKHFDVADDEVLLEVCDVENRTLTTRPRSKAELSATTLIETNWRLDSPIAVSACSTVCQNTPTGHVGKHHAGKTPPQ
jgi:hypothetical protein